MKCILIQLKYIVIIHHIIQFIRESSMTTVNGNQKKPIRLAPEVNKIIFVRNLPYKITTEEMYDVFGRFGPIRQIRKGKTGDKKGTAFIVYEDIFDAKKAVQNLNGFNVGGRYLVALYYSAKRVQQIREMGVEGQPQQ